MLPILKLNDVYLKVRAEIPEGNPALVDLWYIRDI